MKSDGWREMTASACISCWMRTQSQKHRMWKKKIVSRRKIWINKVETNSSSMDYSSYFGSGLSVRIKKEMILIRCRSFAKKWQMMKQTKGTVDVDDGLEDTNPQLYHFRG